MALTNTDLNPIYMINDYIWALLQQELGLTKVGGVVPITTFDGPEFREGNKPYLIYAFNEEINTELTPMHTFTATYAVYSPTAKQTNDIIQLLSMALSREETPVNIMKWANHPQNPKTAFKGINVASVDVTGSEGAMPPVDEGGMTDGYIVIRYRYTSQDKDFSIRP